VLLLVHEPRDPGPPSPRRRRRPLPHIPWRPFAWFAAFCWLLFVAGRVDGLAGYAIVLVAIAMGSWRLDRWLSKQYWGGLSEVQR
jgi:hypothetical protein